MLDAVSMTRLVSKRCCSIESTARLPSLRSFKHQQRETQQTTPKMKDEGRGISVGECIIRPMILTYLALETVMTICWRFGRSWLSWPIHSSRALQSHLILNVTLSRELILIFSFISVKPCRVPACTAPLCMVIASIKQSQPLQISVISGPLTSTALCLSSSEFHASVRNLSFVVSETSYKHINPFNFETVSISEPSMIVCWWSPLTEEQPSTRLYLTNILLLPTFYSPQPSTFTQPLSPAPSTSFQHITKVNCLSRTSTLTPIVIN